MQNHKKETNKTTQKLTHKQKQQQTKTHKTK